MTAARATAGHARLGEFGVPVEPEIRFSARAVEPAPWRSPPTRGRRTPGLRRNEPGLNRSCRGAFRSPRPSTKSSQADGTSKETLELDIQKLKEKRDMLDKEISQLMFEGYSVDELEDHITQLHEYNDVKDVGQTLLGRLAVIRGVTTRELYPEFGLDMND
ncbi:DNA repair protein SWI5 homolog [Ctenodactylus gundi]